MKLLLYKENGVFQYSTNYNAYTFIARGTRKSMLTFSRLSMQNCVKLVY